MKIILKRKLNLFNGENNIELSFSVNLSKDLEGFENFDIDDMVNKVDKIFELNILEVNKLDEKYPMYIYLSKYFFNQISELSEITYDCANMKSIITKEDISKIHMENHVLTNR